MKKRQVIETSNKELIPYKRYGEKTNDLSWLPISKDDDSKYEVYLIKFDPGNSSNFHRHNGNEEFYVIDGELIDDDGKIFKTGDYVKFEKGSEHSSYSKNGCKILIILHGGTNEILE